MIAVIIICLKYKRDLVGGFNPSEKYESDWIIIPTIGENKIHVPNHQPVTYVTYLSKVSNSHLRQFSIGIAMGNPWDTTTGREPEPNFQWQRTDQSGQKKGHGADG